MERNQLEAMAVVASMAILSFPVYVLVGFLTIPIGIGMVMLMVNFQPTIFLYPLVFAGTTGSTGPVHYLVPAVSIPLSIAQWLVIGWLASFHLRAFSGRPLLKRAAGIVVAVGATTAILLWIAGLDLVLRTAHT